MKLLVCMCLLVLVLCSCATTEKHPCYCMDGLEDFGDGARKK